MSLFKRRAATSPAPAAAAAPKRTIDPAAYGFVPVPRADRAGPSPDPDLLDGLVAAADWAGMSTFLGGLPQTSERRFAAIIALGAAAADDDAWLRTWRNEEPGNVSAMAVAAEAMVTVAWKIRSTSLAKDVSPEQWSGFLRVLSEVPDLCARASAIDPADPAPFIPLQTAALGLNWSNDQYRALWTEISTRAPHTFTGTHRAWNYWRPRWHGSLELLEEFIEGAIAAAPLGSNLTMTRIQVLWEEFKPKDDAGRAAFHRSERVNQSLDQGILDAAASDPDHVKLPYLRHWLAWQLYFSGRNAEAIEQFRAIGGYCGATPWTWSKDPAATFRGTRAKVVMDWEDAGRPAR